jgi:hypothetical protein
MIANAPLHSLVSGRDSDGAKRRERKQRRKLIIKQ